MGREILFRGKRIDNGEWVEGDLLREKDAFGEICTRIFQIKGKGLFRKNEVDPETVCQYTGLLDKNGRKIFEGDIVRYERKLFAIRWADGIASFSAKPLEECRYIPCMNDGTMKISEVVGNIFDNSELLQEGNLGG